MDRPRIDVSIIIPTYGRQTLLCEAIESCVTQATETALEIIVVDDGSPDSIEPVVRNLPVRFHRLDVNQGSSAARNVGISMARGRYLKFLDSDDVLLAGSLAAEVALADARNADIVICGWRNVDLYPDGSSLVTSTGIAPVFKNIADGLLAGFGVPTSAALYRRETVGGIRWDASLSKLNDWDYLVRAALASRSIESSSSIAYDWRSHAGERITTSASTLKAVKEFYQILETLIAALEDQGVFNQSRRQRAAQYLYKELRRLYRCDPKAGKAMLARIRQLDANFVPMDEEHSIIFRWAGRLGLLPTALAMQSLLRSEKTRE